MDLSARHCEHPSVAGSGFHCDRDLDDSDCDVAGTLIRMAFRISISGVVLIGSRSRFCLRLGLLFPGPPQFRRMVGILGRLGVATKFAVFAWTRACRLGRIWGFVRRVGAEAAINIRTQFPNPLPRPKSRPECANRIRQSQPDTAQQIATRNQGKSQAE